MSATTSQAFSTLGNLQAGKGSGWDFVYEAGTLATHPGHAIRFAAPSSLLLMVPGLGEGELVPRNNSGAIVNGQRAEAYFNVLGGILDLSRPMVGERLQQYVMQGYFASSPNANSTESNLMLAFGYGIPTPPNALPTSGAADYQMVFTEKGFTFRADYGAKIITGTIPYYVNGPTLASELRDVTISADGASFSGRLIPPDGSGEGLLQGLFMGPTGEEFLAQAILKSGQSATLFSGTRAF
ncbi:hypothetical protein [Novosphingobium sp. Gsoil 351]|uniref:hypothetical protein n=1 Tax=Novosphingobium sp. Gsoil 351 TaxID=2675225 RepID=UPI0012B4F406|nr:hypothetical protein [Novosphingobium sp. Gsoil 351]QGN54962.1 hypothetical protein GKE62_10760 [Novosphingobium sp. Gsoil 351]